MQPSGAPIALYEDTPVETDPLRLRIVQRTLQLLAKRFRPPAELEAETATLHAEVNRLRKYDTPDQIRVATAAATQAGWRAEYSAICFGKETVSWELMAITIGSTIALVSISREPFTETAHGISSQSPFAHTLVSGYSNGGFGYMPPRAAFGEGGYETEASPFSEAAAETLTAEAVRLLNETCKEHSHGRHNIHSA